MVIGHKGNFGKSVSDSCSRDYVVKLRFPVHASSAKYDQVRELRCVRYFLNRHKGGTRRKSNSDEKCNCPADRIKK